MLHASADLHRSERLLQASDRLIERVTTRLAQSDALIKLGKDRAAARARAALNYEETSVGGALSAPLLMEAPSRPRHRLPPCYGTTAW